MKKLNKKGFTLIEMLVVIAIIAVLVAIIIPTVTSATSKANAAADAANLRSVKAEIVTGMLTGEITESQLSTSEALATTLISTAPESKSGDGAMYYIYNATTKDITVYFGSGKSATNNIAHYADRAGGAETSPAPTTT